jgi:DNA-directed RNA polymerase subunit RPC12/RpoP
MPIEFRCTECNRLLRTQDETAGKKAKCPECGAILTIPKPGMPPGTPGASPFGQVPPPSGPGPSPIGAGPSPAAPPPPGAGPESPFGPVPPPPGGPASPFGAGSTADVENPYASPGHYMPAAPAAGRFAPTPIYMGDMLSRTWEIFKAQMGMCVLIVLVAGLTILGVYAVAFVAAIALTVGAVAMGPGGFVLAIVLRLFIQLGLVLFVTWVIIGVIVATLKIARGQEATIGDIFSGGVYFLRVLLANILVGLINLGVLLVSLVLAVVLSLAAATAMRNAGPVVAIFIMVGTVFLAVIPMTVVWLMFALRQFLIVDRNVGVIESLSLSMQFTRGNKLTMFLTAFVAGILGEIIILFTCGLGVFLVGPYLVLLWTVMYLAMTGQPMLDQMRGAPRMA